MRILYAIFYAVDDRVLEEYLLCFLFQAGLYCDVCGHNFFSIRTLRQHRRRIHGLDDIIIETVNPHPVSIYVIFFGISRCLFLFFC